jgi:hypothetical protein
VAVPPEAAPIGNFTEAQQPLPPYFTPSMTAFEFIHLSTDQPGFPANSRDKDMLYSSPVFRPEFGDREVALTPGMHEHGHRPNVHNGGRDYQDYGEYPNGHDAYVENNDFDQYGILEYHHPHGQ